MKKTRLLSIFTILVLAHFACTAAECQKTEMWRFDKNCLTKVEQETTNIINTLGNLLLENADKERVALLRSANLAWANYRTEQCKMESDQSRLMHSANTGGVGTGAEQQRLFCLVKINETRIAELKTIAFRARLWKP